MTEPFQNAFFFFAKHVFQFIMSFEKMRTLIAHQVGLIETDLKYLEKFDNSGDKASFPWLLHCL